MKNPFSGLFRARDKPQDSVSAAPVFYFGTSGSGKSVTVQSAIQLSTVYACVRVISELISWAECFEAADIGTKHLSVARLIDRIEVKTGYNVYIKSRMNSIRQRAEETVLDELIFD